MDKQDGANVKLGIFVGGIAAALVAGFGLGKVITPTSPTAGAQTGAPAPQMSAGVHIHSGPQAAAGSDVGGLAISAGGYTLVPLARDRISFVVKDSAGQAVTSFATVHEKQLHLIAVRRDLTGYQHLHPSMAPDGTWSVPADLAKPGVWRVFADFTALAAGGAQSALTLGYDITVPGDYRPADIPAAARESTVDGQTVTYEGTLNVGATAPLLFRVPGATLEPYLGSFGHLVALRDKDLAYIHVHPEAQLSGGAVKFWMAAPSPGTYRMFFDYQVAGKVRTAEFTLVV
ncbi:MAG TPA: hypothetical protein VFC19_31205 [Candidatus Limnocylindrales bacterium]|nr:hypothetical protein [Candidatus Limnocylindrales bacterium]